MSLKFSALYWPIVRVVVSIAIAPPFGFQKVYSPAVGLVGSSKRENSHVMVINKGYLYWLFKFCPSDFSQIRSAAKPSSPPCPK